MKTLHLSKTMTGLVCLAMGLVVLSVSFYLYEIDFQFDKKERETPVNPAYMGPIRIAPYSVVQPYLTIAGSMLISVGIFLLLHRRIRNSMRKNKT